MVKTDKPPDEIEQVEKRNVSPFHYTDCLMTGSFNGWL